jgi:phosphoglucomutase
MAIKFGTSGWRDIIADGFTFPNLRVCTQAISEDIFRNKNHNKPVIVGYDTRFLSEKFAQEAAHVLSNNGIEVRLSNRDVPTPVVAFEIIRAQAAGGINITASHNPYTYSGLKFSSGWGGPALPETTKSIETLCKLISESDVANRTKTEEARLAGKLIQTEDFRPAYLKHIKGLLDTNAFKGKKLKIVVDVLHGTGRGYLPDMLRELGCEVEVLNEMRDVYFEGKGPDPSPERLQTLINTVKKTKAHLGLATDGDADRFGVVDAGGAVYLPNDVLPLMTKYLHVSRGWEGVVARSCMTTHGMDAVARKYGLEIKETPVGFKHIGEIMKERESIWPSTGGEFVVGGEESGGFTMRGHVPEKDGILACLILAEMVAASGQTITELIKELHSEVGVYLTQRFNIHATPEIVSALRDKFGSKPPTDINGLHVHRIVDIDGYKFIFHDGSWIGVRFSGTEPIVRLYIEGRSTTQLGVLQKAGESLIQAEPSGKKKATAHH